MWGKIFDTIIGGTIRNIPGGVGQKIRSVYWRQRFRACGTIKIDEGVIFHYPEQIEFGDNVWIMAYSVLTGPSQSKKLDKKGSAEIIFKIGDEVQIGAFNVLNATGGITIGDCVTLSARVSVYSATHLPRNPDDLSMQVGCNGMVRRLPVFSKQRDIIIGDGAWLGLHTVIICCNVGKQGFVTSGTILKSDLPDGYQALPDGKMRLRYTEL